MSVYGFLAHAWFDADRVHLFFFSHTSVTLSVTFSPHPGSLPGRRGLHEDRFCLLKKAERTWMTESSSQAMLWPVEAHQTSLFPNQVSLLSKSMSDSSRTARMQAGSPTSNASLKTILLADT
eukprot:CAMPEP_0179013106 /NCGR_PEP_ID=MMETSP0796-20121207/1551_1 /TAXON_ID=73915 /ORGANISM="Pyrodinium bahamense, Strain pbaha01" /LENGTH=121 /DNA_ID=CAMNT_0020708591 /DNA_START=403 /DNA_END=764 /DNA_ORIENTATION=+